MRGIRFAVAALVAAAATPSLVCAQQTEPAPWTSQTLDFHADSGVINLAPVDQERVVYSTVVDAPGAPWSRVVFGDVQFANGAYLRITSMRDGFLQKLDAVSIQQWQHVSAYFNGDALFVELVVPAGVDGLARVVVDAVVAGEPSADQETICDTIDDRLPSSDPRSARLLPPGCSSWMIDDCARCFITAGHCGPSTSSVVQFNVPLSTGSGQTVNPPPQDQYPVDPASIQTNGGQGVGNDYAYFGVFPNSNTGLHPADAQGATYSLSTAVPSNGETIRITGYGTTSSGVPREWNQIQKTHTGPALNSSGTSVGYRTDTTGGNSGSVIINESAGLAIGVHTHGGCTTSSTSNNWGTSLSHAGFQNVLASPRGVCECSGIDVPLTRLRAVKGELVAGNLNSLINSDDNRAEVSSVLNGRGNRDITVAIATAESTDLNPDTGYVEVESSMSAGSGSLRVKARDYNANRWVLLGSVGINTNDSAVHLTLVDPARFVRSNGQMMVLVQSVGSRTTSDYRHRIDEVNVVLNGGNAMWCSADWDFSGSVNTDDLFAFLSDYQLFLEGDEPNYRDPDLAAPFGSVDTNDLFAFLAAYESGCN